MKRYEKAIYNSIKENRIISKQEFANYLDTYGADALDVIFDYINQMLDNYTGSTKLESLDVAFLYLERILTNTEYDRKLINRKINKLDEKINTIEVERKKIFPNYKASIKELESLRKKILKVEDYTEVDINEYQLMKLILNQKIDIMRVGRIFKIFPDIVNIKDKNDVSLYQNVIKKYLENVESLNEENILYYSNVLSTMTTQKSFNLSPKDKRACLQEIMNALDKFIQKIKGHVFKK